MNNFNSDVLNSKELDKMPEVYEYNKFEIQILEYINNTEELHVYHVSADYYIAKAGVVNFYINDIATETFYGEIKHISLIGTGNINRPPTVNARNSNYIHKFYTGKDMDIKEINSRYEVKVSKNG